MPMIVLTPVLAGAVKASALAVAGRFALSLVLVGLVFVTARYLMPRVLFHLVRTHVRELFVLGGLFICLGMALLTRRFGFSLALGAFVAGIILSESEYSPQMVADIIPFRDVFASLFFISIGMLLDLGFALDSRAGAAGVAAAHGRRQGGRGRPGGARRCRSRRGSSPRSASAWRRSGSSPSSCCKVGRGERAGRPGPLPVLHRLVPADHARHARAGAGGRLAGRPGAPTRHPEHRAGESRAGPAPTVVVVGFGVNGRNLARVLKGAHIAYRVVELNGDTVRRALARRGADALRRRHPPGDPGAGGRAGGRHDRLRHLRHRRRAPGHRPRPAAQPQAAHHRADADGHRDRRAGHARGRRGGRRGVRDLDRDLHPRARSTCGCRGTSSGPRRGSCAARPTRCSASPAAGARASASRSWRPSPAGPRTSSGSRRGCPAPAGASGRWTCATAPGRRIIAVVRGGEPMTNPSPDLRLAAGRLAGPRRQPRRAGAGLRLPGAGAVS